MNSNAFHNIVNILIAVVAALMAFDWTVLFTPETGGAIIAGLSAIKLVINAIRDGLGGMTKPQPPVVK